QLQLLTAFLTDPGFRPELDAQLPTVINYAFRQLKVDPDTVANKALQDALPRPNPFEMPTEAEAARMRSADFARLLGPALKTDALEVTIVGDIDEKTAIAAMASSLGALPPRTGPRPQAKAWFMRFPQTLPDVVRVQHEGNSEQAMLGAYWPLYVATPSRRREEYSLLLIAAIMRDQLRHRVREDLGMTYSPDAETRMPDDADQGYLLAVVETRPADAETVLKEVRAMADRLAHGEITQTELDAARTPLLSQFQASEATNDYWASALTFSTGDGQGMRDLLERRQRIGALTVDDLKQAAAQWLSRPPVVILATPAAKEARK
ncbi:MAG TPA: insulinase family protein, partial [Caulobacteraceae bacterium]|nr:insulinase family protein [Caulobacteraceae bacterium]